MFANPSAPPPSGLVGPCLPGTAAELALYSSVPAGFPPAEDYAEGALTHELLVLGLRRPSSAVPGRRWDAGINDGDLLVVDRSVEPGDGDVVVATVEGGLTVKRLSKRPSGWALAPANPEFPEIPIDPEAGIQVWGVVTWAMTPLCGR